MKKNNIIIIVILSVIILGLCGYIICDKFITKKSEQSNQPKPEETTDSSKYDKSVKWSTNIVYDQDKNILYQIVDKKLICESNRQAVCDALGENNKNLIKVALYSDYGDYVYVLNENGEVYMVDSQANNVKRILDNYRITNMTKAPEYKYYTTYVESGWSKNQDRIFFLTTEDQLVDANGESYEESNKDFVMGYCFKFGNTYVDGYGNACIFMNDKGYVSYKVEYKNSDGDYVSIKNRNNQNMSVSQVYDVIDDWYKNRKLLFVDSNSDLYEFKFVDGQLTVEYINNIISTTYVGEKDLESRVYTVSFELSDGTEYEFDTQELQYLDVKTNTLKKLNTLSR